MVATSVDLSGFGGVVFHPGESAYEEARSLHNALIDTRPLAFLRCSTAQDVITAIGLARQQGLQLSIRSGGHSITGSALVEGGLAIDLRAMNGITIDPDTNVARAEGGICWGEFDAAAWQRNLAVTGGRVPSTGVVGLALGSGSGWLERKFGYTCDNVVGAEVVTADGRLVTATATENQELFWGLRGGGGNFGVVTALHIQLHELPQQIFGGRLLFPADQAPELLRFYRSFMESAPDEVGSGLAHLFAPDLPHVPESVRGKPAVGGVCCYAGPAADGAEAFEPLRRFGAPVADTLAPMSYVDVQRLVVPGHPHGMCHYWSADFLSGLPDEAIDTFIVHSSSQVSATSQMLLIPGGGALSRFPADETAFGRHDAPWSTHYQSMWTNPEDTAINVEFTDRISAAMKPWTTGQAYLNYLDREGDARIEEAFGSETFARLRSLKQEWDPTNFFRFNQNIPPARLPSREPAGPDHA